MADSDNSASTMMVAIIAIVVIAAIGFIVIRMMPTMQQDTGGGIELDVTGGGTGEAQ
jgi:uncharacterized membrane-anchored protein YhcB (DUF1043 family)